MTHDFFTKLNLNSKIAASILDKVKTESSIEWKRVLQQNVYGLSIDDFILDQKIHEMIKHFSIEDRLSVFKYDINSCYNWHIDKNRMSALNMVLDGFDSVCVFGRPGPVDSITDMQQLNYAPNTYYLLNTHRHHMVLNFSQVRYVVSIGFPEIKYQDVITYLKENNMIEYSL